MKGKIIDNLQGRVVGYTVPHRLDPGQVEAGEPLETSRTRWGTVVATGFVTALIAPRHGPCVPRDLIQIADIHTTMPASFR